MSRGLRPVTEPVALPEEVLDISPRRASGGSHSVHDIVGLHSTKGSKQQHEVLDPSCPRCRASIASLVVTFEDFSHKIFSVGDCRAYWPERHLSRAMQAFALPEVCTG
jgi:hypothetical protein